ncbi:transcriptional regulator, TetR family [Filimonas lacunae]|uniref:Transcriptional regulator, TetR family n=1 Tax=Filimonas lacunae TaxID=477680 RepID=A0A173MCQ6_9BACT|nr:TetR/AcrR family transcriptional regulator [Filimonas lacunae]BAV05307.1 transcriptional regulator, TetR family [Filimonas lacunae]SIT22066.1 transcriptional regulator, TetR family [Filimonas lacunae]
MARNVEFDEEGAIQKAMEVFWKKGYNGSSLRDLTDAMKINSSSLYNTIGDKQELFVRCVQYYTDIRKKDFQQRLTATSSPLSILINYINDAVKVIINGEESCMAIKAAFEVGPNDERIKDILKADNDYSYQFLYKLIKAAMDQGEIASDEDPKLLADYFNSTWIGWNESFILHRDPAKIKKMAQYFIKQLTK